LSSFIEPKEVQRPLGSIETIARMRSDSPFVLKPMQKQGALRFLAFAYLFNLLFYGAYAAARKEPP
jgi:hypothetical protein